MTPFDLFKEGVTDASTEQHRVDERYPHRLPKVARELCLSCLRTNLSLKGEWEFHTRCVFCKENAPINFEIMWYWYMRKPNPKYAENPWYIYGFAFGVAARCKPMLTLGAHADEPL